MGHRTGNTPFAERARSPTERQAGAQPTAPENPIPVRTWILTTRGEAFGVDAEAVAWTVRAVRIVYTDKFGRSDTAWVWAGDVQRR